MNESLRHAIVCCLGIVAMMTIDLCYLGIIAKSFYRSHLDAIGRFSLSDMSATSIIAGIAAWSTIVIGLYWFVIVRNNYVLDRALIIQALFYGFVVYGTYNFTNHSFLRHWPLSLALCDTAWGMCVNAIVAVILTKINAYL